MANNFDNLNINDLNKAYEKAKENTYDNEPLPEGTYRVKVEKIELAETGPNSKNPGFPMGKIQFRIVEGEYKKQCLFMNKVLVTYDKNGELTAIGLKIFDEFLNSLEPTFDVAFSDCKGGFSEYADLLLDVAEDVEPLTYDLELSYNGDFANYEVVGVYE